MQNYFNWNPVTAFGPREGSWKLHVEEGEDTISMGTEMLKRVTKSGAPEETRQQIDQIVGELSSTLDKLRKLRTNMKSMV